MIEHIYVTYRYNSSRVFLEATCNGETFTAILTPPSRPATTANIIKTIDYLIGKITHGLINWVPDAAKDVLHDIIRARDDGYTLFDEKGYTVYLMVTNITKTFMDQKQENLDDTPSFA